MLLLPLKYISGFQLILFNSNVACVNHHTGDDDFQVTGTASYQFQETSIQVESVDELDGSVLSPFGFCASK